MVKKTVGYVQYASIYILINKRLFACSYVCIKHNTRWKGHILTERIRSLGRNKENRILRSVG